MLIDFQGREIYVGGPFYNTAGYNMGEVVKIEGREIVVDTPDGRMREDVLAGGGRMMEPLNHSSPEALKADIDAGLAGWFCGMQFRDRKAVRKENPSTCGLSSPFFRILRSEISDVVRIDMEIHFDGGQVHEINGVRVDAPGARGVLCATEKNSGLQNALSGSDANTDRRRDDILRQMFGG